MYFLLISLVVVVVVAAMLRVIKRVFVEFFFSFWVDKLKLHRFW